MSEVAGRMAVQVGAQYLEAPNGGRGILLGGIPGVAPANVAILGGGVVGHNAAKMAVGLGRARHDHRQESRPAADAGRYLQQPDRHARFEYLDHPRELATADLVVGAVLIPGRGGAQAGAARDDRSMKRGAVVVDVAIDQGGCFETSHATTHTDPIYFVDGVLHYCVSNMPAAVPHTSTFGLTNATFPYVMQLASKGLEKGVRGLAGDLRGRQYVSGACHLSGRRRIAGPRVEGTAGRSIAISRGRPRCFREPPLQSCLRDDGAHPNRCAIRRSS